MNTSISNKLGLIVLAICLVGGGGCASQRSVDAFLTNVKPMPSTLLEQRAQLDIRIQNLSEVAIEATGMELELQVNGRRLARGVSDDAFTVPRLSEKVVSIVVSSSLFDTIRQFLALDQQQSFSYALRGTLYTPGLARRFVRQGEFSRDNLESLAPVSAGSSQ